MPSERRKKKPIQPDAPIDPSQRSLIRAYVKRIDQAVQAKSVAEASIAFEEALPLIELMVTKGIMHKFKAAKLKSRLTKRVQVLADADSHDISFGSTSEAEKNKIAFKHYTVDDVQTGLNVGIIEKLSAVLNLSINTTLDLLELKKQTYLRRRKAGRLSQPESDRVLRFLNLIELAETLFGDQQMAAEWLTSPAVALHDETPAEHAKTEFGARNVQQLIGRLMHGIPT